MSIFNFKKEMIENANRWDINSRPKLLIKYIKEIPDDKIHDLISTYGINNPQHAMKHISDKVQINHFFDILSNKREGEGEIMTKDEMKKALKLFKKSLDTETRDEQVPFLEALEELEEYVTKEKFLNFIIQTKGDYTLMEIVKIIKDQYMEYDYFKKSICDDAIQMRMTQSVINYIENIPLHIIKILKRMFRDSQRVAELIPTLQKKYPTNEELENIKENQGDLINITRDSTINSFFDLLSNTKEPITKLELEKQLKICEKALPDPTKGVVEGLFNDLKKNIDEPITKEAFLEYIKSKKKEYPKWQEIIAIIQKYLPKFAYDIRVEADLDAAEARWDAEKAMAATGGRKRRGKKPRKSRKGKKPRKGKKSRKNKRRTKRR